MALKCRFYESELPEVGEAVVASVRSIQPMGAYVALLEYQEIEGMILLSELSRRRIRSVNKLLRVGRSEVVSVIRVDSNKKYIDLSKRQVSAEEITACEEKFANAKAVNQILQRLAQELGYETQEQLEELCFKTSWFFDRKYGKKGASFDVFKQAVKTPEVLDECPIETHVKEKLLEDIRRRMTPQAVKIRCEFDISCFTCDGIEDIKYALLKGLEISNEEIEIKINLITHPFFLMTCQTLDKEAGLQALNNANKVIEETIKNKGGSYKVVKAPEVVNDHDEANMKKRMKELDEANAEVSGDDSNSSEESDSSVEDK